MGSAITSAAASLDACVSQEWRKTEGRREELGLLAPHKGQNHKTKEKEKERVLDEPLRSPALFLLLLSQEQPQPPRRVRERRRETEKKDRQQVGQWSHPPPSPPPLPCSSRTTGVLRYLSME